MRSLAESIRTADGLIDALGLPEDLREPARAAEKLFPTFVPRSFLARMRPGDPADPLLRQVLPLGEETAPPPPGYATDAVGDAAARPVPGLLHKYRGRALLILAGACAVHCRYCFRRHYPYGEDPRRLEDWEPAFEYLENDPSIREVLLSGGDPLMLTDDRLRQVVERLECIPHLTRLRVHTRLPIVLPDRVTDELLALLRSTRLTPWVVVHANHANELVGDCAAALRALVQNGTPVLNQAVLLKGVNDDADALCALGERLADLGVQNYYLHQLDRVAGAGHFEVPDDRAAALMAQMHARLPGYAVPRLVREEPGAPGKTPL
ncbi:L-lysine 2,3-aminomutase [Alienimonas californiensis]|uniref:L-lysine 2,3-aminomutase n=2 Tax=Alienimonas californiensis TaxID=2527989 RepID=A0A517P621_9PLAN|nr:L-lysine 2,3-aminomutase [Alienimonas californiensis]